jgi:hypothetical protein
MADLIALVIENFTLTFFLGGSLFSLLGTSLASRLLSAPVVPEKMFF